MFWDLTDLHSHGWSHYTAWKSVEEVERACREALNMKAWSPEKFQDVSDVSVSDEDGFSSPQHDDPCKHHDHTGASFKRVASVLFFVWVIQTLALCHGLCPS